MSSGGPDGVRTRRNDGPWVSISAAARALGISTSTLRVWASEGRVPHVRTAGGHRRFNPEGLRDWLAKQPGQVAPLPRSTTHRIEASAEIAGAIREAAAIVPGTIERHLEGQPLAEFRRMPENEQRGTVGAWLDLLADAFASGSMSRALDEAASYGAAHGRGGSSAEITLTGSLALERALDSALAGRIPQRERRRVSAAMASLTLRVALSWAEATGPPTV
ncbi:MAG: MerR family DNA-binding transcriptional regulator [Actinobacteria bacterium]|nr:MerR family DNA-binding transcriptional regulator [Actinomycetota bacterium]